MRTIQFSLKLSLRVQDLEDPVITRQTVEGHLLGKCTKNHGFYLSLDYSVVERKVSAYNGTVLATFVITARVFRPVEGMRLRGIVERVSPPSDHTEKGKEYHYFISSYEWFRILLIGDNASLQPKDWVEYRLEKIRYQNNAYVGIGRFFSPNEDEFPTSPEVDDEQQ